MGVSSTTKRVRAVACPFCGARVGAPCRYADGSEIREEISHTLRVLDALKKDLKRDADGEPDVVWTLDVCSCSACSGA